ncbi:RNA-directed DNA polymerase from mobile element jockey [Labeo rohita]|uniref:RNA-directed DNA polymerase from mobile element jockey n=1 Tax=Labeo rohita TaxID=84645 RepID=A0ABQ8L3X9_LABRO|nr:RNA-directed DNA polymerase from mobile element jockey [Labeo rohita]
MSRPDCVLSHGSPSSLTRHGIPDYMLCRGPPSSLIRRGSLSSLTHHGFLSSLTRPGGFPPPLVFEKKLKNDSYEKAILKRRLFQKKMIRCSALLIYDRQTLYNIRASEDTLSGRYELGNQTTSLPPFLADILAFLRRSPCVIPRKKRWRQRGKRRGVLVRFKAYLASTMSVRCPRDGSCVPVAPRSLATRGRWLCPVFSSSTGITEGDLSIGPSPPVRVQVRVRRGVDSSHLRPLGRAVSSASDDRTLRLGLINARSLANKTFLLNDFFTSRELDFMFLTETWLHAGELTSFSELLPPSCDFLSSPRTTGKGGGLASVFKSVFHCREIVVDAYNSFELQLFETNFPTTVLCAVVYRPPKYNKNFIQDFADFVAGIALNYDRFLISVTGPTHEKGHTLDLVLSYGLCITVSEICDTCISDHLPVLFTAVVPNSGISTCASARSVRAINPLTASQFSGAFKNSLLYNRDGCDLSVEEFTVLFDYTTEILDSVAPLKKNRPKVQSEPWLNETTHSLRRASRVAERKWKKDKLEISFEMMKDALRKYQRAVKTAKTKFSQIL